MQLYANPNRQDHLENNAVFIRVVNDYPQLSLYQPSPEKAPWHWQCIIDLGREVQLINFWPHTLKGQRDGYKAVQGETALRGIIEQALIDAVGNESFDVIEGV